MLTPWNKDDIASHRNLDELLSKKINWTVTTPELIQVYRALVWFASLKDKIEKSQVENLKVTKVDTAAPVVETSKKAKKGKDE